MPSYSLLQRYLLLVTVHTADREPVFRDPLFAEDAVQCLYRIRCFNPFFLHAFVVMPDHCKILLDLRRGSISNIVHAFQAAVEFEIGRKVWDIGFELKVVEPSIALVDQIQRSPVTAGLCDFPEEYEWSSANCRWDITELPVTASSRPAEFRSTQRETARYL